MADPFIDSRAMVALSRLLTERNAAFLELDAVRAEVERLRAERDAARAQLHADDQRAWEALGRPGGTHDTTNVQRLCAEVERLRFRVGWLNHLDTAKGRAMHATEAVRVENEQLCADLRCALRLLRQAWSKGVGDTSWARETFSLIDKGVGDTSWARETFSLIELHKETNQ